MVVRHRVTRQISSIAQRRELLFLHSVLSLGSVGFYISRNDVKSVQTFVGSVFSVAENFLRIIRLFESGFKFLLRLRKQKNIAEEITKAFKHRKAFDGLSAGLKFFNRSH